MVAGGASIIQPTWNKRGQTSSTAAGQQIDKRSTANYSWRRNSSLDLNGDVRYKCAAQNEKKKQAVHRKGDASSGYRERKTREPYPPEVYLNEAPQFTSIVPWATKCSKVVAKHCFCLNVHFFQIRSRHNCISSSQKHKYFVHD